MRQYFLIVIILNVWQLDAQTIFPKGAYMTQNELLERKPGKDFDFVVEKRSGADISMNGGNNYKLLRSDSTMKRKIYFRKMMAYSDGEYLYINGLHTELQKWYCRVEHEGRFLLMVGGPTAGDASVIAFGGGAVASMVAAHSQILYALDLRDYELVKINKKALEEWLETTPELLADYQQEEFPKEMPVLLKYASLRNQFMPSDSPIAQ
jgi:hypothetical protein